jgi:CHAD domain-containing protein
VSARPDDDGQRLAQALRATQRQLAGRLEGLALAGPRQVHATRVAARRLRSLLKTFRPLLAQPVAQRYRDDLKRLADALAELREVDVMASLEPFKREPFATALAGERDAAAQRVRRRLRQPALVTALARLRRGPTPAQLGLAGKPASVELLRRVRKAWRHVARATERDDAGLAARHELRIRLKHCRYSLEIVSETEPQRAARLARRLRAGQQALGDQRDLAAALAWLRQPRPGVTRTVRMQAGRRLQHSSRVAEDALVRVRQQLLRDGSRWDAAVSQVIGRARQAPARR